MEANQILRARFSSAVSTALEDVDIANKDLLSSIDCQYLIFTRMLLRRFEVCVSRSLKIFIKL